MPRAFNVGFKLGRGLAQKDKETPLSYMKMMPEPSMNMKPYGYMQQWSQRKIKTKKRKKSKYQDVLGFDRE